jgi:hypothetical protein
MPHLIANVQERSANIVDWQIDEIVTLSARKPNVLE